MKKVKLKPVNIWAVAVGATIKIPEEIKEISKNKKEINEFIIFMGEIQQAIKNMASPKFSEMFSRKIRGIITEYISEEDIFSPTETETVEEKEK